MGTLKKHAVDKALYFLWEYMDKLKDENADLDLEWLTDPNKPPNLFGALVCATLALNRYDPEQDGVFFGQTNGVGKICCNACGYSQTITSFTHGLNTATIGYQCQSCLKFIEVIDALQDEIVGGCSCGGTLDRRKLLRCPNCKSSDLDFEQSWMT